MSFNSLNRSADVGHVDFLEKVHQLAEKPYIIAGLHFDQVRVEAVPGQSSWGLFSEPGRLCSQRQARDVVLGERGGEGVALSPSDLPGPLP